MIKKFTFRLEQVLRYRASIVEMRERALAEIEAQLVVEQQVLDGLFNLRSELLGEMAKLQEQLSFASLERDLYQQYLDWIGVEQDRERRLIGELEALREAKRSELVTASQEHRIVERLKERQREAHMNSVARSEQSDLDEVAGNAFARGDDGSRPTSGWGNA